MRERRERVLQRVLTANAEQHDAAVNGDGGAGGNIQGMGIGVEVSGKTKNGKVNFDSALKGTTERSPNKCNSKKVVWKKGEEKRKGKKAGDGVSQAAKAWLKGWSCF